MDSFHVGTPSEREESLSLENRRLLEELELAYRQLEFHLMASSKEARVTYDELERKNRQLVQQLAELRQAYQDLKDAGDRLRSLAAELSLTEERERRRYATELHDRIGVALAISKIKLRALQEAASSTGFVENLDEIRELIEQSIQDTRSLVLEISPPILYELGFGAAVEWLLDQAEERHALLSDFEDDGQPKPLDDDIRVLLFQAVRELLVNVVKHAQARKVKVFTRRDGEEIWVIVEDDGVGFDVREVASQADRAGGFGLFSIRERLGYVGGLLVVKSEPGHGTQVTLVAPLKRDKEVTKRKAT